jgi:hypothetical protein
MKKNIKNVNLNSFFKNLDICLPGRLRQKWTTCGKQSCSCSSGQEEFRHGPYTYWDAQLGDTTVGISIPKELVPQFQLWIKNKKKFDKQVNDFLAHCMNLAQELKNSGN